MLHNVDTLRGYRLGTKDGDAGKISDLFFDDDTWTVRYLVVHKIGSWLNDKRVLVVPRRVKSVDPERKMVEVDLTRSEVEASPPAESDRPLSECMEILTYPYHFWPPSFEGDDCRVDADVHLRSVEGIKNYGVAASDGDIGRVLGLLVDDDDWVVRYLLVDTRVLLPGRQVLISPEWIEEIDWAQAKVKVDLTRDTIKKSPVYDPEAPVTRNYEGDLCHFYNREGYWERSCGD